MSSVEHHGPVGETSLLGPFQAERDLHAALQKEVREVLDFDMRCRKAEIVEVYLADQGVREVDTLAGTYVVMERLKKKQERAAQRSL